VEHATEIFKGMCAALQHAHAENIVHADFKPGNVFVTRTGATKVFDFGIARAVAQVDARLLHQDNTLFDAGAFANDVAAQQDKSVFDPGTLGALTPTYASVEMLRGETPTTQDDVFALAIVTYEMLAGHHPFKRINAEEAMRQNLKPKRIKSISRYQWKALKKALAFLREDRTGSVYEFMWDFTHAPESSAKKWLATAAVLALGVGIGIGVYTKYFYEKPLSPEEIKAQLEQQIKIDLLKSNLTELLNDNRFTDAWQENLWQQVKAARQLIGMEDQWLIGIEAEIVDRYIERIANKRNQQKYSQAQALLANAENYRGDPGALDRERIALNAAIEEYQAKQKSLAQERERKVQQRAKRLAEQKAREAQKRAQAQAEEKQAPKDVFALALNNVKQQLRCRGDLNTRNFKAAVQELRSISTERYNVHKASIISSLAVCIERVGKDNSNRALDLKAFALTLFPGNRILANLDIAPKDPCGNHLAGLGARGITGTCRDRLYDGSYGPRLVVIPGGQGISTFAIGKFEISVGDFNEFCISSKQCDPVKSANSNMPVTNVSYRDAKAYVRWLSRNSGYDYRIPRRKEWLRAAKANNSPLDDNRNCSLKARGINKGGQLEIITAGRKNRWGLVNHVGNAQEWVLVNNRNLVAIGGAHSDPIQQCQYESQRDHSGEPDAITGFRVLRELRKI
jgi:formylglycine-generating enzyme required for sulfatase activity